MRKVYLVTSDIEKLYEKGVHITQFNREEDIAKRGNRDFFFPNGCQVGRRIGLWGGVDFPVKFGSYSYSFSPLKSCFSIGNYCSIATGLRIMGYRHPMERFTTSSITYDKGLPLFNRQDFKMKKTPVLLPWNDEIKIEDDVWIGANVTLKKGITLHTGCVVGANSLVTHDVPPYAVVGGIPAKVIKYRFDSHMINRLLESRWFDYDVNYLNVSSDIYTYDFVEYFLVHKTEIPKLQNVSLADILARVKEEGRKDFLKRSDRLIKTGTLVMEKDEMQDEEKFILLLEMLYRKGILQQNVKNAFEMCFSSREREMILLVFLRLEKDGRLEFFSMKNGNELWMHYVPYLRHEGSKAYEVPLWAGGQTWPGADRVNNSAFAAYMRLLGSDVFISIELSAKDTDKAREIARAIGYEEDNSPGSIIRLETKRFSFKDEKDLPQAVNGAMDEFCKVGEKLVEALGKLG